MLTLKLIQWMQKKSIFKGLISHFRSVQEEAIIYIRGFSEVLKALQIEINTKMFKYSDTLQDFEILNKI